jgi:mannose-6-phosphate isomerase-like protein (cupin superfamily)
MKSAIGDKSTSKAVPVELVEPARDADLPASTENPVVSAFSRDGFIGPIDLFTQAQCDLILKHYRRGVGPAPDPEWFKDLAARDRFFYEVAKRPALVALLRLLLGEDIVLWGATVVERTPGQRHIGHTDIETSGPDGRFVSVWVGLEDTCRASALQLISRSHRFGRPIQQEVYERGLKRGEATDQMVTAFAQEHDARSDLVQPDMRDGQALLFDGRLWHGSHNAGDRPRAALLLQYAAAGTRVVIPDFNHMEWPFRFTSAEPPCVMVSGSSKNYNVTPPPSACPPDAAPLCSQVLPGSGFHESSDGWIPYHLFQGPTPLLTEMESHVSVLSPGHSPHSPHCHVQEEILIVLSGEAEILIAEGPDPGGARVECLGPGSFVYYPAYQYHTIRNTSEAPVTYLMYKWQAGPAEVNNPMQTKVFDIGGLSPAPLSQPMSMPVLFEAPTGYLHKLHAHVTDLQIGASYPAHVDEHDVAIVVFTGTVETLGRTVGPGGTIFYAAGEPHGMRNVGKEPARYLVFEFHRSWLVEIPN